MATLNWIGKEAVVGHDKEVPFKLLKKVKSASVGEHSQNLIVHGDNLEALKALMPHYVGKVKCIYIDPPYNTGNEGWVYNDKVNSPKIKQWLGKIVGGESVDLTRHDKWMCMMYPRLKLLRDLLTDDGVIFVSIDDNEHCNLRGVMDEIFDEMNFIGTLIWQRAKGGGNAKDVVRGHEYVAVYKKSPNKAISLTQQGDKVVNHRKTFAKHPEKYIEKDGTLYFLNDDVIRRVFGKYTRGEERRCEYEDLLKYKSQKVKDDVDARLASGEYVLKKNKSGKHYICRLEPVDDMRQKMYTIIQGYLSEVGKNDLATLEMEGTFDYPKPVGLIRTLIDSVSDKDSLILDSFAGSGTTGQAVLDLNKRDGGNRKFILVEMEDKVAKDITVERVKRAIKKYGYKDGFEYCELDKPLFNEHGQIEDTCDFKQFATYIYFTETQTNIDSKKISGNFIGESDDMEYYLLYKGKLQNDLDKSALKIISNTDKKKVIYADRCLLDEDELKRYNITFKQIPYEVKVY